MTDIDASRADAFPGNRKTTVTATLINLFGVRRGLTFETEGRIPPFYVIHDGRLFCLSMENWCIPPEGCVSIACTYNETCRAHDATGAALTPPATEEKAA